MQRSLDLRNVSFGKDDAAIEARQGFLGKVFLKTSFYHRVRNRQKFLVTGRKGSGKSAICFSIKDALEAEGRNAIFITTRLLSVPKMQQIKGTAINDQERFESSWRYIFLVKIAIELIRLVDLREQDFSHFDSQERRQLREVRIFLSRNNEIDKDVWQKLISFLNIFSKFSAKLPGGMEAGIETRQIETVRDLSNMLDKFEECILALLNKSKIFGTTILVDEVDDIWDSTEESKPLIIGLLNAVRKLNSSLNPNIAILLFLRSDIWDGLSFSDKDKFRSEDERISWSEDDLKQLIVIRAKISANLDHSLSDADQVWDALFEKQVGSQNSFEYIVDRTLKRPREVIQFCNLALSVAQDFGRLKITEEDILAAEARYSIWKLDDLINEFKIQYPFLRDFLSIFDGFRVSFSKDQINLKFEESKKVLVRKFPELHVLDLDSFLQLLFGLGFVGARVAGKDLYLHDDPDRPRIVLTNLVNLENIVVHPAFHLALGLRSYIIQSENISITQQNYGGANYQIRVGGGNVFIGGEHIVGDKITNKKIKQIDSSDE